MADPFTLAAIGGVALTQGISFLYTQAGELIKRWRGHKDAAAAATPAQTQLTIQAPAALGGRALTVSPDLTLVATRAEELLRLRAALSNYADNVEPVNPNDSHLIQNVAELRAALEAILGVHLTFEGEDRPASGQPMVTSTVQVGSVEGTVTGVQVGGAVTGGRIDSDVTAADVRSGGSVTGVSIGTLGPPAPSASPGKPPPSPAELHDGGLR
jgi:hypothetical protein